MYGDKSLHSMELLLSLNWGLPFSFQEPLPGAVTRGCWSQLLGVLACYLALVGCKWPLSCWRGQESKVVVEGPSQHSQAPS